MAGTIVGQASGAGAPGSATATGVRAPALAAGERLGRRDLITEIWLLLAVSLGMSGLFALIRYIGAVTRGPLRGQVALLNGSAAPGRPWLDLALQLAGLLADVAPAFLAVHLLSRHCLPFLASRPVTAGSPRSPLRWARWPGRGRRQDRSSEASYGLRRGFASIGFDGRHLGTDLALGAAIAACVGGTGLGLYLLAWHSGASLTVAPSGLPEVWWRIPVLLLSALQNAVTEEVIVGGYLLARLRELGWGDRRSLAASAVLRGSYHLYQGLGGFFGNLAMGVLFGWLFQRRGRVVPMIVAHTLIDSVAFVGYVALAGSVSWLPTSG
ncbi:CPBP family intramembrane glutamic endopeptidase [Pseudofrankia sp. DC12]|uniref:CPBP family intramembrane glutamic endopeptidase n=1 Tax=Pseudofrankia sp. DC12 TaxID=683315 RepID=UPI000B246889|nr:CPBP family intramembrane glutamic endopeptidase [Pseudofrankia sp. DC12]